MLIEVMPYNPEPYTILIDGMIENNKLDHTAEYLYLMEKRVPDAYSAKWLGIYHLVHNNIEEAGRYLELSIKRNGRDPQAYYNLAGVYINQRDYRRALEAVNRCLAISPDFPGAARTKADLEKAVGARP